MVRGTEARADIAEGDLKSLLIENKHSVNCKRSKKQGQPYVVSTAANLDTRVIRDLESSVTTRRAAYESMSVSTLPPSRHRTTYRRHHRRKRQSPCS